MKVEELMIGDWVEWMGNKCKVDLPLLMTEYQDNVDSEFVKPIPLTDDILKKNVFVKGEDDATFITRTEECYIKLWIMSLCIEFEYQSYFTTDEMRININYVHELQHALRLCGLNELANNFKI